MQDLSHYPFDIYQRQISLPPAPMGRRRFSERATCVNMPEFSLIRSCGSTPWLRAPVPFPSDFRRPSSLGAGRSTHTVIVIIHSRLYTLFYKPRNSSKAPDSTSSMVIVLQECKNTRTHLWIRSIKSALKRGSLAKALSYCRSKRSM